MYACAEEKANWMFCSLIIATLHLNPLVVFLTLFYFVIFRLPERGIISVCFLFDIKAGTTNY